MNLASTDFEIFGISPSFTLDQPALDARWRDLQAQVHPDRFVADGIAAKRLAMQRAVRVNEAYQRLKNPVTRATYLCKLNGVSIDAETNTAMPTEFLMQHMAWRETLAEARTASEIDTLLVQATQHRKLALQQLTVELDQHHNFTAAAQQVRALMFMERFARAIDQRLEALEL
jgi:molecular chaperone HscB